MKKNRRKIFLSIFSFATIFATAFATTMAWIGVFTYANTQQMEINLKTMDFSSEYFLTISSTGEPNSFSDEISIDELRKEVLKKMDKDISKLENSDSIAYAYHEATRELSPSTTYVNSDNSFAPFKRMDTTFSNLQYDYSLGKDIPNFLDAKNQYLCFDIYLSVDTKEGISEYSEINSPVFLTDIEDTLLGTIGEHVVLNNNYIDMDYSSNTNIDFLPYVPLLKTIPSNGKIKVNVANSVRIGFEIFEPIPINDSYNESNRIAGNVIYYGGKLYPSFNNGVYDLGGIIPTEFNTAAQELMNMKSYLYVNVPDEALNRKERELSYDNSQIWNIATDLSNPNNYLGVHNGVRTKMRLRTYVWFEGWDADCLHGINKQEITVNLTFTADHELDDD